MPRRDVTDIQVCQAYGLKNKEAKAGRSFDVIEHLAVHTGQPEKVVYRAMERAYRHGLVEFGVSLRSGWLTEKGEGMVQVRPQNVNVNPDPKLSPAAVEFKRRLDAALFQLWWEEIRG
jgi:hypothetical protein